jgi:hypothetical protein
MMKKRHLVIGLLLGCIVIFLTLEVIPLVQQVRRYKAEKADYTRHTTPLTMDTVKDICSKLGLPGQDARCNGETAVYAPEFFDDIKEYVRNLPKEKATQEEVDRILGPYKIRCSQPATLSSGKIYYSCLYDMRGDGVSIISVYFHGDGTIDYIMASAGSS